MSLSRPITHSTLSAGDSPEGGAVRGPGIPGCARFHIRAFLKASPLLRLSPLTTGTGSGNRFPACLLATQGVK